ncbi:DHA2 family efflux MFS transporter permease subunit [Caminibacter mediatlanticus TB-2]|uniref:DHA2 family efflux MFS transporter permease subunit n=1 Tax=Caminibacter mediatlanticus TB-2 TaxID=391592 RepID=A0ABX5V6T5_9BACT|nr:DHA2 family efflux MFS transporter permease subunit [Caminibacter mediatlanticus]QCT93973.1 DHA2 family efflux MFS transporter permease subunit [Caminibacter mediatlanticus TB-2]
MQTKSFSILHFTLSILLVITGAFMAVLDTTVVDIIVPRLKGPLSTDIYGVQWVITAYMIAAAVGLLVVEWLIKKYGSTKIYLIGVAVFTLASFMCGISNSLVEIITARVIQGFAEALVMVTAQAIIFSLFPPEKRGIAMGIFALGVAFAPAVGPTLGGYLTEWFSWRAVFFVNVPIGIILVIFGSLLLPDIGERKPYKLNIISLIFLTIFTVALLIMLSKGQQYGWFSSDFIVYLAFISWFGFLFFVINEYFSKNKLFDYSLFKNYYYTIGILVYFILLGFSMYQYFYLIPIYYEQLKGLPSIQTGLGVLGFGIWIGVFSLIAGVLSDKFSPIPVLIIGALIYLYAGYFLFPTLNYYTPFYEAVLKTMPFGIAMGLFFAPITVLVMNNSNGKIEQGIMTMDYVRFIGGSFGTAIATNNLVFYKNKEFDGMVTLQEFHIVNDFLQTIEKFFGIAGREVFRMYEEFMSFNYGFKYVWLNAAFWGLIGSLFIFALLFKRRNNEN